MAPLNKKISVILAAHNEADNLPKLIDNIRRVIDYDMEIILVDDGSTDNTAEIALSKALKVIKNPQRMGKGYTLRRGIDLAAGDIALFIDADLQDSPEDIKILIESIEAGNDLAIGSKFIGEIREGAISRLNFIGNITMTGIINLLFGSSFTDSQSGFKAMRMDKLKEIELISDEYEIETELLLKGYKRGLKIVELPVIRDKRHSGKTGFRRLRNGARVLFTILKERILY